MIAALMFLAGGFGYYLGVRDDRPPGPGSVDVGFLQDMISHHEQAIQMSWTEINNGAEPGVQVFGREIVYFQALRDRAHGPQARRVGLPAREPARHRHGVDGHGTSRRDHAGHGQPRRVAERMARNQRIEVNELEAARLRTGLPDAPPAYEEAVMPPPGG